MYLVTPPPQTSKITQQFSYTNINVNTYEGDVKMTYETGYGMAIGIYSASTGYTQGCSVSSTATASRRTGGVTISYEAVVVEAQVAAASQAAAQVTPATMSTKIADAATALQTTSTVTAPTEAQTTKTTNPVTVANPPPSSSAVVAGSSSNTPSTSPASVTVRFTSEMMVFVLLAVATVQL